MVALLGIVLPVGIEVPLVVVPLGIEVLLDIEVLLVGIVVLLDIEVPLVVELVRHHLLLVLFLDRHCVLRRRQLSLVPLQ